MDFLKHTTIPTKLRLLVLLSVAVALLLSCAAFVVNDIHYMRKAMVWQLTALADVLGSNTTAALTFDDSDSARQVLESLAVQPSVKMAAVFDAEGNVFATYHAGGNADKTPVVPQRAGHRFTADGQLEVNAEIVVDDQRIGLILLHATLDRVDDQLLRYAAIVAVVLAVSFAASYLLASRLQRAISGPILALAETAQQISAKDDYSIRVQKTSDDELGVLYDQFNRMLDQVQTSKHALQDAHIKLEERVVERTRQLSEANRELSNEIAERRRTEQELERVHREFVDSARRAGMAEIASGVLHNVGNVLNSVNVSATTLTNRLKFSKRGQLDRLVAMIGEHRDDLHEFLTEDEKGKQIPTFLKLLADQLRSDEETLLAETGSLVKNIDHIKAIIATQQSYAGMSGVVEPINVNTLLDDAVRLNSASFARHHVRVERDFADLKAVLVDKQRLLQIVINLVKNAKESLAEQNGAQRVLTLRTTVAGDRLIIEVYDTGVGIKKEDLARVFSHGFTTKKGGHGFGLHSSANSAAEMDGVLTAHSEGHMKGATFTLNLPFTPAAAAAPPVLDMPISIHAEGVNS